MWTKRILIIATVLLSIALVLYMIVFHSGLSTNHEEWGSFGSYIGGIGGIVLSCSLFYYTYTIDKEHREMKKNTQVLKLIDVVGESLAYIEKWKNLNSNLNSESIYARGTDIYEQMKNERDQLEIKLWTNYKTTQVLANHLFKIDLPYVDALYKTEEHFNEVFNSIKKNINFENN